MGNVTITVGKKPVYIVLSVIALFASFNIASAVFTRTEGWHPLKQITNDTAGTKSVDANENGLIDYAEHLRGTVQLNSTLPNPPCNAATHGALFFTSVGTHTVDPDLRDEVSICARFSGPSVDRNGAPLWEYRWYKFVRTDAPQAAPPQPDTTGSGNV